MAAAEKSAEIVEQAAVMVFVDRRRERSGTLWIIARDSDGRAAITVADDGRGFSEEGGGTGIGLKNVRERLKLAYGDAASFAIVANFPKGVAATITLPRGVGK